MKGKRDFGCHTRDTPVWALDLDPPEVVERLDRRESLEGIIPAGRRLKFHVHANEANNP